MHPTDDVHHRFIIIDTAYYYACSARPSAAHDAGLRSFLADPETDCADKPGVESSLSAFFFFLNHRPVRYELEFRYRATDVTTAWISLEPKYTCTRNFAVCPTFFLFIYTVPTSGAQLWFIFDAGEGSVLWSSVSQMFFVHVPSLSYRQCGI